MQTGENKLTSVELEVLPRWDLSNVYPSLESDKFKQAVSDLNRQVDRLDVYLDESHVTRARTENARASDESARVVIDGFIERTNSAFRLYSTLNAFVNSYVTTDSFNSTAKRLKSEAEMVNVRLEKQEVRFKSWIGSIRDQLPNILAEESVAKNHAFYLRETAEQSRYMMSEQEENLSAELNLSGSNAWSKLQGTVTSQLTVKFDLDGKTQTMPITALQNLNHHPDPDVRRSA